MAKINFGDYLKSKDRKEAVYESDDSIAKRARALIDADSCSVQPRFRVENYRKAMDLLEQIPDHPDTAKMLDECRAGLESAQEDLIRTDFEHGKYHFDTASTEHEFRKASDELAAVSVELKERREQESSSADGHEEQDAREEPDPRDQYDRLIQEADSLKVQADEKVLQYAKKTTRRRWIALIVVLAVAAAAVYAWVSGYGWYLAAKVEGMSGIYESAYSRFYKLGDYLDSREQYKFYKEKYLRQREQAESRALPDADVGDTVEFSGYNWLVLEKDGTKLHMICNAPKAGSAFDQVSYDGAQKTLREEMGIEPETDEAGAEAGTSGESEAVTGGSASWSSSSLRSYLNETVLEHEFTPAEIASMELQDSEPTSNEQYGTKQEEKAQDKISILSVEQAKACMDGKVFKGPSVDMWLRTPGHDMKSAAYMTSKGIVMFYGNDVADDSLSVCPLIIVDYTKLDADA